MTLLILTVLILGALTFFPVLALGPIAEDTARLPPGRASEASHVENMPKTADMTGLYPAAIRRAVAKLDPRSLWRNPVIFVTAVVAALTTRAGPARPPDRRSRRGNPPADRGLAVVHACCSPTSPKPWPKGAARPAPTRFARPSRKPACGCWLRRTMTRLAGRRPCRRRCARASSFMSRRARSSPPTARWCAASPRSTKAPSPARVRP